MLARVLLVAASFYGLGALLMLAQRRGNGTSRTAWRKYATYGAYLAVMLLVAALGAAAFAVAVLGVLATTLAELTRAARLPAAARLGTVLGGLAIATAALMGGTAVLYPVAIGLSLATLVAGALARDAPQGARSALWGVTALVGVATPGAHLLLMAARPGRFALFAFLFLVVCCADAFAELVGRRWPLGSGFLPASPGKTVVGLLGGTAAAVAMAIAIATAISLWTPGRAMLYGLALSLAATLGDLVASSLKRAAGIKDFGAALADHGGVLDRFDSLLFAACPFYWMALR
jgi:phosphatidate cytidylyltransferase